MWTTDNDHGAQLQFHTGRHVLEGPFPTIGSWVHYGLGSLNDNLPQFVVLGTPLADCCGGVNGARRPATSGPSTTACGSNVDPTNPLPFASRRADKFREEQKRRVRPARPAQPAVAGVEYPDDPALRARIKSYELAFRMQTAVPEVVRLRQRDRRRRRGSTAWTTRRRGPSASSAWRPGGWSSAACGSSRSSTASTAGPGRGTPTATQGEPLRSSAPGRPADRRAAQGPEAARPAGRDAGRLGHRVRPHARAPRAPTAATTTPTASPSGWPAAASRAASSTARPTSSASTPSRTGTTSPTSTPPCCTSSASTPRRLEVPGRKRLEIDHGHVIKEILA